MSQFNPAKDVVSENRKKYDAKFQNRTNLKRDYEIGTLEYPDGLRTKPDLQHYVAFFINVRDKGRLGKNAPSNKDYYVSREEQDRINLLNAEGSPRIQPQDVAAATKTFGDNIGAITAAKYAVGRLSAAPKRKELL